MINLINDLPDTTKISEGKLNLHRLPLNINELLSERVEEIRRTTKHYFELQFEALPTAQADRERIGQVVTHLLSNAIKYWPRESRIIIRTEQTEAAIEDSIQDEGYDISEEHLQKIFKRVCGQIPEIQEPHKVSAWVSILRSRSSGGIAGAGCAKAKTGKGSVSSFMLPL